MNRQGFIDLISGARFGTLTMVLVCALSVPNFVSAGSITSQTVGDTAESPALNSGVQSLGTGITGSFAGLSIKASTTIFTAQVGWTLVRCDVDNPADGSCTAVVDHSALNRFTMVASGVQTLSQEFTPYTFDATKYYFLNFSATPANGSFAFYGTTNASNYPNGQYDTGSKNIKDLFFVVSSVVNYQTQGITSINSPTYAELVTSGNNVEFDFDYYINTLEYDKAGFTLVDNTSRQSVNVSSLEEDINASGSSNYLKFFDLITGHNYTWTPYLRNSSDDTYLYGTPTFFFTGSNRSMYTPATSSAPLWNGCANFFCQGAITGTSSGILTWDGGTTTQPLFGSESFDQIIRNKIPFSYAYDIKQLLYELANGTSTDRYAAGCSQNDAYYTLPYGKVLDSGSSTIKFIDACAIQNFSIVKEIRKVVGYGIYLITGIGLSSMFLSLV